jgi:hypothetical protein
VIGDMTASTLGGHAGRAVFQRSGNRIVQAPLIQRQEVDSLMKSLKERLVQSGYDRSLIKSDNKTIVVRAKAVINEKE